MAQTELPVELADEIRRRVFEVKGFMKVTQTLRRGGNLFRVSLRPVEIRGEKKYQGEMTDTENGNRPMVKNFSVEAAHDGLEEMIAQTGTRELHLITASGDLHVRVTRKGKVLVSRSGKLQREVQDALPNDRVKDTPLTRFDSVALLQTLGIMNGDGRIIPSMRGKYDQVNSFLAVLDPIADGLEEKRLNIVDCGCGRAYLTLALCAYLMQVKGLDVRVCGIDRRADVIATARKLTERLDMTEPVSFVEGDIDSSHLPFEPDMVVSLHACDTATDEAIARAVEWKCRHIFCAPCCQHELHKSIKDSGPMAALLHHGILRERLADLLTDTFRAQLLRVLGFRVNVQEFVSQEATARNILLKAEYAVKPGQWKAVAEYLELRDFWQVTPWLETRLREKLERYLRPEE